MFDFAWKIKNSFEKVKKDVEDFKQSANDWIVFLDERGNEMEKDWTKLKTG